MVDVDGFFREKSGRISGHMEYILIHIGDLDGFGMIWRYLVGKWERSETNIVLDVSEIFQSKANAGFW